MKHVKKLFAFALTLVMAFGFAFTAYAEDTPTKGTITINNAAMNEKYTIYKVLDATINDDGGINYTGEIPEDLKSVLEVQTVGTYPNTYSAIGKNSEVSDKDYFDAIENYAKGTTAVEEKIADSSGKVTFNVAPGYYVVTSTQGTHVMIDSATNPASVINEKNTKTITAKKEVNGTSFSIGDTITYTATFDTTNYYGTGDDAKIVSRYEISDTLPEFLSNVNVTSITIGGKEYKTGNPAATPQFNDSKTITIRWATKNAETGAWTSLYNNGSKIVVVYKADLTSVTNINAADTNTVKIQPILGDGTGNDDKPWNDEWEKDAQITTYAAALKKVDGSTEGALKGAQFTIKGLTVTGEKGIYTVVSYNNANDAPESTVLDTDDNGLLYILGLGKDVELTVTEVTAPDGYNKLTSTVTLEPQVLSHAVYKETTTVYYDAKGNLISSDTTSEGVSVTKNLDELNASALKVLNNKGTELPSTGGIGTTIFYVVGGVLVVGAVLFLLTKRRAAAE